MKMDRSWCSHGNFSIRNAQHPRFRTKAQNENSEYFTEFFPGFFNHICSRLRRNVKSVRIGPSSHTSGEKTRERGKWRGCIVNGKVRQSRTYTNYWIYVVVATGFFTLVTAKCDSRGGKSSFVRSILILLKLSSLSKDRLYKLRTYFTSSSPRFHYRNLSARDEKRYYILTIAVTPGRLNAIAGGCSWGTYR